MKKLLTATATIIDFIATSMMAVMVVLVLLQIFARYVLRVSIPWTEELARYTLIYIVFLGSAIAIREKKHIVISFLIDRLRPRFTKWFNVFAILASMMFLYGLTRGSIEMIGLTMNVTTGSLYWLKMGYVYMAVPVGCFFMMIYLLQNLIQLLKNGEEIQKGEQQ